MDEEIKKFLNEKILGNPPLSSNEMRDLDEMLTKILRESNQQKRDELRVFLKRWEIRTLFMDALREEKDIQDKAEGKKSHKPKK